jgi:hypothetical protein
MYHGAEMEIDWVITASTARSVQNVGQAKPTKGCSRSFRPPGIILSREIIKKPTLGTAKATNLYRLYYESARTGKDEFIYKTTWEQNGRVGSAVVKVKITVVDRPI